jgi:predicted Zn-dependent protease
LADISRRSWSFPFGILTCLASAQRTIVKTWLELVQPRAGRRDRTLVAAAAEQQLPILNDARMDAYLNRFGRRLAEKARGEKYSYQFKAVNDKAINAFALPGGYRSPSDIPTAVRPSPTPCL